MLRLVLPALAALAPQEDAVTRAEHAYRAGDFAAAHAHYSAALATPDAPRGHLLFHLGNCAWRMGRPAEALWHYRRARAELPRDPELGANLRLAEDRLGVEAPPGSLGDLVLAPLAALTRGELLALASVLQGLGLAGFLLGRRRPLLRVTAAAAVVLGAAAGVQVVRRQWWPRPHAAVVLAAGSTLHDAPRAAAPVLLTLRPGETLAVAGEGDGWLEVTHALGTGYVAASAVGLVD